MLLRFVHRLQPIILTLALALVVWVLYQQWPTLRDYPWRLDLGWLLAAVLLTLTAWFMEIVLWVQLIHHLGKQRLDLLSACRIWFLSAVVRYIPGNIWQPLSLTLYTHRRGIPVETTLTSLLLFQVLVLITTLPIALFFALWDVDTSLLGNFMGPVTYWLVGALLAGALALLIQPAWLMQLIGLILHRMGRQPLEARLNRGVLWALTAFTTAHWLVWGAAFAAFTYAFVGDGIVNRGAVAPYLIASFSIAYAIGFLSFITPSGFGIREGAFYLLLVPRLDGAVVTVIALGMRAWTTAGELLLALGSAPFVHNLPTRSEQAPVAPAPDAELRGEPT